jgi:hypothetical protein
VTPLRAPCVTVEVTPIGPKPVGEQLSPLNGCRE